MPFLRTQFLAEKNNSMFLLKPFFSFSGDYLGIQWALAKRVTIYSLAYFSVNHYLNLYICHV